MANNIDDVKQVAKGGYSGGRLLLKFAVLAAIAVAGDLMNVSELPVISNIIGFIEAKISSMPRM